MVREAPRQDYYPRARLRLTVRLEEFADTSTTPAPPAQPPHYRKGIGIDPKVVAMSVGQDSSGAWYIGDPPPQSSFPPGFQDQAPSNSSDARTFKLDPILPTKLTVVRNGIRVADTCSATFRFQDLPLDPRVIRSLAVEAFIGTVSSSDFATQMTGGNASSSSGSKWNTLPDSYTDQYGRDRTNLRFQGYADEIKTDFDDDGEPLVSIECTDNTALLLDQEAPPKLSVSPTDPIDKAIANYLANFPQFRGLSVLYLPTGATPPTLKVALAKTAYKPTLGPPPAGGAGGGGGGGGAAGGAKFSTWDYLTDIAGALGLIVRMQGTQIILQRPRTLYGSKFSGRPDDPFTGRNLPTGRVLTNRLFVYGRNIIKQGFSRKLRRPATRNNIEVRSWSGRQNKTLVGRFPGTTKDVRQKALKPGNNGDEQWHVHTVAGIEDEATLRAIAQSIYEQSSRPELDIRFQTINLGSYGGDNNDPDCLDMEAGDAIDVETARASSNDPTATQFIEGNIADQLATRASSFLTDLGFSSDFAGAYGAAVSNIGLSTTYRVKTVSFDFTDDGEAGSGNEDAIVIDIEGVNYIEVRQSQELPAGEEILPTAAAPSPVTVSVDDDTGGYGAGPVQ